MWRIARRQAAPRNSSSIYPKLQRYRPDMSRLPEPGWGWSCANYSDRPADSLSGLLRVLAARLRYLLNRILGSAAVARFANDVRLGHDPNERPAIVDDGNASHLLVRH